MASIQSTPARRPGRRKAGGFTLIELMIVIAIIAVLAAIAYSSYQRSVTESRRKVASACLLEGAQFMERFYTTNLRYNQDTAGNAVVFPGLGCVNEVSQFYTIGFNGTPTATAYSLQAVPQGGQATRDTECGTLGINQSGTKTRSGSAAAVADCW